MRELSQPVDDSAGTKLQNHILWTLFQGFTEVLEKNLSVFAMTKRSLQLYEKT
jgi:hypothetical protein